MAAFSTSCHADKRILSHLRFRRITLSQIDQVESIRSGSGSTLHVYTFASLYSWQKSEQYSICLSDDAYIIRYGSRGNNAYLFPCGSASGKKKLINELLLHESPVFFYVSDSDRCFLEKEYPGIFSFTDCRDDYPYLYDKDEQIALPGKEYKSLRHQVNLGRSVAQNWSTELLAPENIERAILINRQWADGRISQDLADTSPAETALSNFSRLRLWGLLFIADGKDIAYTLGTFITPEIYDICFCKVLDNRCDCYVKWSLYNALPPEVKTVDSEEDMGIPGLRTHKLLRRPKELVRVWKGVAL